MKLKLTIVDTVGFGDQINKEESYKPVVEYINQQFENYLQVATVIRVTFEIVFHSFMPVAYFEVYPFFTSWICGLF